MEIVEVTTKRHQKSFLKLPFDIYIDTPQWTPPILHEEKKVVGFTRHPFYERASIKHWLCYTNDTPVGRIAAIDNSSYPEIGFFGFFECYPDVRVASYLLDKVHDWLKSRGKTQVVGPVNPSFNYTCGILTNCFDEPTAIMMPYNHEYYDTIMQMCGMEKAQDLLTYYISYMLKGKIPSAEELLESKIVRASEIAKRLLGVTTRRVTKKTLRSDVYKFLKLYNESMRDTWMFAPLSASEMVFISGQLKWLLHPDLVTAAVKDDKIIGALIDLPDINPTIREINGSLFPFGWLKMLSAPSQTKHIRVICTNVLPEYQMFGVGGILVADSLQPALNLGYTSAEFSWVLESNTLASETLKRHGAKHTKTHRIYLSKL